MQLPLVSSRLAECEQIIERGLNTFVEVGSALLEIRDSRLYKELYGTFEEYCRERWGMSRIHAHRTIEAAQVVGNLLPIGNTPANETQARPLVGLSPDTQMQVWQQVVETAPNGKITGEFVQDVVDRVTKPHVAHNSGVNEWYTPSEYIKIAEFVMDGIDLDPASSERANQTVGAKRYYTKENSGLEKRWTGKVWMNPPYSSELIEKFISKYVRHVENGDIDEGVVLVNNATETGWFAKLVSVSDAIMFPRGRVRFLDPDGNPGAPLQGQAVVYSGENVNKFLKEFSVLGWTAELRP